MRHGMAGLAAIGVLAAVTAARADDALPYPAVTDISHASPAVAARSTASSPPRASTSPKC